jgi:hypothetical protein
MTTKEIAQAVGKDERTIQRWAASVGDKMSSISDKMSSSTSTHPADFTLTETMAIIEKGMGKNAADIWRENATRNAVARPDDRMARLEGMVEKLCNVMAAQINRPQIEFVQDYYTIKGYASKLGMQIAFSDALHLGREAGKVSRERSIEVRKADDERFGQVNSYHTDVLREVFQL